MPKYYNLLNCMLYIGFFSVLTSRLNQFSRFFSQLVVFIVIYWYF